MDKFKMLSIWNPYRFVCY